MTKATRSKALEPLIANPTPANRLDSYQDVFQPQPSCRRLFEPLLVSRAQVARILGDVSTATIIRLENAGKLTPIKLSSRQGKTFYAIEQVRAVAEGRRS